MMSSLLSVVRRHPIVTFFVLTYAIGWGCIPFWTFQAGSPFIAALIVIPLTQGLSGLKELGLRMIRWRVRWYWYVVAVGMPLAVVALTAALNVALGASAPSLAFGSVTTVLMMFAVRLVNPGDGALGEEPGWRGVALPGLQTTLSPLVSTMILGVVVTVWHVPLLFLEEGLLQPSIIVGFLLGSFAVTFFYTWLFNHTGGSVLMTIVSHAAQGTIQIGALWSVGAADFAQANLIFGLVTSVVAIGLVVFDRKAWRAPAAPETTTPPQAMLPRGAAAPVA